MLKKIVLLMSLILCPILVYSEMETIDVKVDSYTYKSVQVNSSDYTNIISTAEIYVSSGGAPGSAHIKYSMVYWQARHNATTPVCYTPNNLQPVEQVMPMEADEIYKEEQYRSFFYAKIKDTFTGTTTVWIQIGYRKMRP